MPMLCDLFGNSLSTNRFKIN